MLPGRTEGLQKIRVDETDESTSRPEKGMRKKNRVDETDERTRSGRKQKQYRDGNAEEADPRRECRRSRRRSRPEKGMKKKQTREGNAAEVAGPEKGMQKAEEGGLVSGSFSCKLGRRY